MRNGAEITLSPRSMNVLVYLAERAGETVTHEELIAELWPGAISSANAIHKCVVELRQAFGNGNGNGSGDAERAYIETVPKRGYRLVAPVERLTSAMGGGARANGEGRTNGESAVQGAEPPIGGAATRAPTARARWILAAGFATALAGGWVFVQPHTVEGDIITLAGRSAVILPASSEVSAIDRHTIDAIREKMMQTFKTSGAHVQSVRRTRWRYRASNDAAGWDADYAVQIELTQANDQLGGSLEILPADSEDPSRREQFDAPNRQALADTLLSHASEDLAVLLDTAQVAKMRDWGTSNVDAYRYAREGDSFQRVPTMASQVRAEELFRRAVTEDPTFGYGYIQSAAVYAWMAYVAPDTAEHERQRSLLQALLREAAQAHVDGKFLELIDHLYRSASVTNAFDAEKYWHEELVKSPTNLDALIGYAELLVGAKLTDEGQRYIERALQQPLPYGYEVGLREKYSSLAEARGDFEEAARIEKSYVVAHPDDTLTLYAIARNLATLRRFEEAEVYLARVEGTDPKWGFAARTLSRALAGDIPKGSEALHEAFGNPLATNALRSDVCFTLGDVECGVRYRRQTESTFLRLLWVFNPGTEQHWPPGVVEDRRYQAALEELGIGRTWRAYMRAEALKLAPVSGIEVTTPPPAEDIALRSL